MVKEVKNLMMTHLAAPLSDLVLQYYNGNNAMSGIIVSVALAREHGVFELEEDWNHFKPAGFVLRWCDIITHIDSDAATFNTYVMPAICSEFMASTYRLLSFGLGNGRRPLSHLQYVFLSHVRNCSWDTFVASREEAEWELHIEYESIGDGVFMSLGMP
jgi:hypothetical protein